MPEAQQHGEDLVGCGKATEVVLSVSYPEFHVGEQCRGALGLFEGVGAEKIIRMGSAGLSPA